MRAKNKDGLTPLDFAKVGSEVHEILMEARHGDLPEIEETPDVSASYNFSQFVATFTRALCHSRFRLCPIVPSTCLKRRKKARKRVRREAKTRKGARRRVKRRNEAICRRNLECLYLYTFFTSFATQKVSSKL